MARQPTVQQAPAPPSEPVTTTGGPSAHEAGGVLTIDLSALYANYRMIAGRVLPGECAAVVKGGRHMEAMGTVDTVVLDKTGTLTFGEPFVTGVMPCPGEEADWVLRLAAIAERPSEHPLGKAMQKEAARWGVVVSDPEKFEYMPGRGVRCIWNGREILVGNAGLICEDADLEAQLRRMPEIARDVLVACQGRLVGAIRFEVAPGSG